MVDIFEDIGQLVARLALTAAAASTRAFCAAVEAALAFIVESSEGNELGLVDRLQGLAPAQLLASLIEELAS